MKEMNSFLKTNFEFNNRILKSERRDYHTLIQELPSVKIDELDKLDSQFDLLIFKIDSLILTEEADIDKTISESNHIFRKAKEIVKNITHYSLEEFKKPKTNSNELILNHLKNRLVIAMSNAFQYANGFTLTSPTYTRGIDSIIASKTENGIKLTLTSKYGQSVPDNRDIIINSINFNGQEKKIYYKLKDNYSFADIEFDSLESGIYKISGILKYYERSGELESWFEKEFEVE
ncbi:hypothetical protein [Winogradskyella psychrotolerans]|uniref:hypothetical protein n=1 Tax=Winogradskyella psychrotolerans TaxID=1344585 RepID=UPI001C071BCA|nr:hypothetical protein [Winogradskyella psychrotolerans]MBU2928453.1 hypothetical protein [Winogradskyella psychrotolerans]